MRSQLSTVRTAATQLAAAADKAVRAKAKIHSPSRVSKKLGMFWGKGLGGGMLDMVGFVRRASQKLVSIPNLVMPNLALAYGGELSADYSYSRNAQYVIDVPLTLDGREVAKACLLYTSAARRKSCDMVRAYVELRALYAGK